MASIRSMVCAVAMLSASTAQRPGEEARYVIDLVVERRVTSLPADPLYWRIERFESAAAAKAAEGPYALAATVSGRHWLFTLGPARQHSREGRVVAEIGPVTPPVAKTYLLRINRAGGPPGSHTPVHTHPGAEAIYVLDGRVTQRTPHGVEHAGAGEILNAHAPEMVMQLTSSGTVDLEQMVMFVVDADRPFSPPASFAK